MKSRTKISLSCLLFSSMVLFSVGCSKVNKFVPATIHSLTVQEFEDLLEINRGNPQFVLLDVRTPTEFTGGHIEGAINVDFEAVDFQKTIGSYNRNKTYMIYCRSGNRSLGASELMVKSGFNNVYNMLNGISGWQAAGFPVVK